MKKLVMIQKLKGNKNNIFNTLKTKGTTDTKVVKPLEIYDIKTDTHTPLFSGEEKRIFRTSGLYQNFEICEKYNAYGVKFNIQKPLYLK